MTTAPTIQMMLFLIYSSLLAQGGLEGVLGFAAIAGAVLVLLVLLIIAAISPTTSACGSSRS